MQLRERLFIYMTTISFDYKTFLKCTSSTRKKQKQLQLQNQIFNFWCNPISQNLPFTKVGCTVMTEKRTKSFIVIFNKCLEAYQIKTVFSLVSQKPIMWHMEENCNIYLNILTNMKAKDDEITKIEQRKPIHLSTIILD